MPPQISKNMFVKALNELGHDARQYEGKRLSLEGMSEVYNMHADTIVEAIERHHLSAHYDYSNDTIWVDALDAAYFHYCVKNEAHLYSAA